MRILKTLVGAAALAGLMTTTSLAVEGRGKIAQAEHRRIVQAIEQRDEGGAEQALRDHISVAFVTRLKREAARTDGESHDI